MGSTLWRHAQTVWKKTNGRPPNFKTANALATACFKYFQWLEQNALEEARLVTYQGDSELEKVPLMHAPTIQGLCVYIGINGDTWRKWRAGRDEGSQHLRPVVEYIDQLIYESKFTGAASGQLNANLIARDLGLKESTDADLRIGNPDGSAIEPTRITLKGVRAKRDDD